MYENKRCTSYELSGDARAELTSAYKLSPSQILVLRSQTPNWSLSDRFDIQARADGNHTKEQMRLMMRLCLQIASRWFCTPKRAKCPSMRSFWLPRKARPHQLKYGGLSILLIAFVWIGVKAIFNPTYREELRRRGSARDRRAMNTPFQTAGRKNNPLLDNHYRAVRCLVDAVSYAGGRVD